MIQVNHDTPILLICERGIDRSGCLKIELVENRDYTNVVNAGVKSVSSDTLKMLADWAQLIIVIADVGVWEKVPWDIKGKAIFENIGKDIWLSPMNPLLQKICKQIADNLKL